MEDGLSRYRYLMNPSLRNAFAAPLLVMCLLLVAARPLQGADSPATNSSGVKLADLMVALRTKAKGLEGSNGMRQGFQEFTAANRLSPANTSYPDYVISRLIFEATRDAGFWNLHWKITNLEPNSDNIWRQWKAVNSPEPYLPTASAECDELSALYAFMVGRAGIHGVGLFWPYSNHTVAVWVLHPPNQSEVRVVVPTTQIFLDENDLFGTKKFNAWKQKSIFEYKRRDVPDAFEIPKPLSDFFLQQVDKYAGASDITLQRIRYLREGVLRELWTPEQVALAAMNYRDTLGSNGTAEDRNAYWNFALDMRSTKRIVH
jgi:hypothetical protein